MIKILALIVFICGALGQTPSPPIWPNNFVIDFAETTYYVHAGQTNGTIYYDAANNRERVDRATGAHDRYCASVNSDDTPCSHIIVGGYRYLYYPQENSCCMCCTSANGCGITSASWLSDATFQGYTTMNGYKTEKWEKSGLQSNYYYVLADGSGTPVELDQTPNDYMAFNISTFKVGGAPASVFDLPSICTPSNTCPFFSICTVARREFEQ